ncbi:MAG: sulfatase [Planctomycetes bacterium]|nr:sulfatase [Planctomycetota bacterium]
MQRVTLSERKVCFVIVIVSAGILSQLSTDVFSAQRPNVLWIIAEDMGPELGCYGTPEVWTPNLDRFAGQGMLFTHAFTTAPVCSASRSAFMTGMYQTTIGAHNHRSHRRDGYQLPQGVKLLPHRLRDAGVFTANIRHLTENKKEPFYKGTGKTDWNFNYKGPAYDSDKWSDLKNNQPFYAQINFSETHRGGAWNNSHKHIERTANPQKVKLPPYYPDHPVARKDWAQYLNTVMALDKKVGFVLNKLEEDGMAENTVVLFFGDHGRAMVRGKQWCYDSGLRVPCIMYWPKGVEAPSGYEPGTVSGRIVEAIDFTATTLNVFGIKKPESMQGRILFGPNADPPRHYAFGARDRCDETVFRIRTVRDSRFRYIRNFMPQRPFLQKNRYKERQYPMMALMRELHAQGKLTPTQQVLMAPHRRKEELYDLQNDPYEVHNLAESPEHQKILNTLRGKLESWIEASNDQGRIPEPKEVLEYWERTQQGKHEKGKKQSKSGRKK